MKTNKHQTLLLTRNKEAIRARDIVTQFGYSSGTARSYLSYLARHGLLNRTVMGYVLTEKGRERLEYFNTAGCSSFDCPLCLEKNASCFICPGCGYELPKKEARILPKKDFLFVVRHAGVYCPECEKLIFTEKQAQLIEIRREK